MHRLYLLLYEIDGVVGEIIFHTLGKVCGDEFNNDARVGWIKIISRILDVVLPIVINFELKNGGEIMKKITDHRLGPTTSSIYSEAESSENFRTTGSQAGGSSHITNPHNQPGQCPAHPITASPSNATLSANGSHCPMPHTRSNDSHDDLHTNHK